MNIQKMAAQIARLKTDAAKKRQAHLLCLALVARLKGIK